MTNAGHPAPLLLRQGKGVNPAGNQTGCPLGIDAGLPFEKVTFELTPQDTLLLFTDGVTEARNSNGELFGTQRVQAALCHGVDSADAAIRSVLNSVAEFSGHDRQDDDTCLVALRRC